MTNPAPRDHRAAWIDPSFAPDLETARGVLLGATRGWIIAGVLIVIGAFGGVGGWAALAPIAKAVVVEGFVKVDSNHKRIQHQEGGTVKEVRVKDGTLVKKGEVLIVLDRTEAESTYGIVASNYNAQQALQARLVAERDHAADIIFPAGLGNDQDSKEINELKDTQRRVFEARQDALHGSVQILEQQIRQFRDKQSGITAQRAAKQRQVDLVTEELKDSKTLLAKGFIQKPHILGLEREMARARGQLGNLVAEMAETAAAISEKEQQILQVQNEFDAKVVDELREVQASLMDLSERYQAADHVLNNIEILAPEDGVVVNLSVFSARQVIAPGETLMELVPMNDKLLIETRVETQNVDNVSVGMHADVRFTAIDKRNTPLLDGVIGYVSADSSQDERTGLNFFTVRIEVSTTELDKLGKISIQPGMPAEVVIKFGERTVFGYLARPISDVITRAWKEE